MVLLGRFLWPPVYISLDLYVCPCTFLYKSLINTGLHVHFPGNSNVHGLAEFHFLCHVFSVTAGVNSPVITNYFPLICNLFLTDQSAFQQHAEFCLRSEFNECVRHMISRLISNIVKNPSFSCNFHCYGLIVFRWFQLLFYTISLLSFNFLSFSLDYSVLTSNVSWVHVSSAW